MQQPTSHRWVWQTIPALQLPSVQAASSEDDHTATINSSSSSKRRSFSLVARVESRVAELKEEEDGMAKAIKNAEEILRARRRDKIGRWANERNFAQENQYQTAGRRCCRRRERLELSERTANAREARRETAVRLRDARQRLLIVTKAMATREIRKGQGIRDRAFGELVRKQIYLRTGGNVRDWLVLVAGIKRLLYLKGAVERKARNQKVETNLSRIAIVTRFLGRSVLLRRRNRAANVIAGALGGFTNSNAVGRYARRVKWGSLHIQAVARRRMDCMAAHLILLSRRWERLFPLPPTGPTSGPPPSSAPLTSPAITASPDPSPVKGPKSKRPAKRKAGGGGGGKQKGGGKGRSKRQGEGTPKIEETAVVTDTDAAEPKEETAAIDGGIVGEEPASGPQYRVPVCSKARDGEILAWLQQTRAKYCKDFIEYEQTTVFPCMVELLLQHRPEKYPSRLLALQHVSTLRMYGRLSRTWIAEGFYAKMSHLVPPPPRMPRLFSVEKGEAMYQRAAAKSVSGDASATVASAKPASGDAPATAICSLGSAPENDAEGPSS